MSIGLGPVALAGIREMNSQGFWKPPGYGNSREFRGKSHSREIGKFLGNAFNFAGKSANFQNFLGKFLQNCRETGKFLGNAPGNRQISGECLICAVVPGNSFPGSDLPGYGKLFPGKGGPGYGTRDSRVVSRRLLSRIPDLLSREIISRIPEGRSREINFRGFREISQKFAEFSEIRRFFPEICRFPQEISQKFADFCQIFADFKKNADF